VLPDGFSFKQDSTLAHTAHVTQDWLQLSCPGFIEKDQWTLNSSCLKPLDYDVWGAMLEKYHELQSYGTSAHAGYSCQTRHTSLGVRISRLLRQARLGHEAIF
jgi:hypothetical protein